MTTAGELFRTHASDTLARWQRFKQHMGEGPQLAGSISIFASVTACQSFLPRILDNFRRTYPDIHIKLETGYAADALSMLERGSVEVAVAALPDRIPARLAGARGLAHAAGLRGADVRVQGQRSDRTADRSRGTRYRSYFRRRASRGPAQSTGSNDAARYPTSTVGWPATRPFFPLVSLGCGWRRPAPGHGAKPAPSEVRQIDVQPESIISYRGVCTDRRKLAQTTVRAFWDSVEAED